MGRHLNALSYSPEEEERMHRCNHLMFVLCSISLINIDTANNNC